MRSKVGSCQPSVVLRVSTVCLLALGVSGCSSDTMRFTEAPFANPFKTAQAPAARDPATTGSINRAPAAPVGGSYAAPASATAVRSQPLPPPQSAVALRSAPVTPVAGSAGGWSAQGGTPIVIAEGETLDVISSRYGVPRAALISANGLSSPEVAPGSRLTIPVYNASGAAAPAPARSAQVAQVQSDARPEPARRAVVAQAPQVAPQRQVAATPDATSRAKAVAEARAKTAAEAKTTAAEAKAQAAAEAKAKAAADAAAMREARAKFAAEAKAKAEAKKTAAAKAPAAPVVAEVKRPAAHAVAVQSAPAPAKPAPTVVASAPATPVTVAPKAAPAPAEEPRTTASLPKAQPQEDASERADFRWPARGRVIAGFSGKGGNEGINIAVPEGTPIKAAEGGTVAYAGNELKGYGNLVLIRHPNGYVSAYAHNGELKVKRGDTVKRGQVVANSGQTGNVSSPQLHFELRKGASPVDPTPYLNN